jgi:hypothetical protein
MNAVVGDLAEAPNTYHLTSHLERSGNDGGYVEAGGKFEGSYAWVTLLKLHILKV